MEKNPEHSPMRTAHLSVGIVGLSLVGFALPSFGLRAAIGVFVGALIASVNLLVLSRAVSRLVQGAGVSWVGVALLKFFVLLGLTYALIDSGWVQPLALAVGFGALPLGIVVAGTWGTSAPLLEVESTNSRRERDHA